MEPGTERNTEGTTTLFRYAVAKRPECSEAFTRWKKIPCKRTLVQISGEWSQSPYHYGDLSLLITVSEDRSYVRVQVINAVPSPIILVAQLADGVSPAAALPGIVAAIEADTAYAWPSSWEDLHMSEEDGIERSMLRPARHIEGGRLIIDEEDDELARQKRKRDERRQRRLKREAEKALQLRREGLQQAISALISERHIGDQELARILNQADDEDLRYALDALDADADEVANRLRSRADAIYARKRGHRGWLNGVERSFRKLAERLPALEAR